jgi:hypothetical protein
MEGEKIQSWEAWKDKRVYLILKSKRQFSGVIVEVEIITPELIFLTIVDKFGSRITFSHSEIQLIQEQSESYPKKPEDKKDD